VLFGFLRITVEEEINHDVPWLLAINLSSEAEDLTSEQPVHQSDGVLSLVVAGDGNVNMS